MSISTKAVRLSLLGACGLLLFSSIAGAHELPPWVVDRLGLSNQSVPQVNSAVQLARRSSGVSVLVDQTSGLSIRFRLLGAADRPYRGLGAARVATLPAATHVLRQSEAGIEDYVFWPDLAPASARYRVEMDGVMGLRVIAGVIEFLDGDGTPRIRVRAPWVAGSSSINDAAMDVVDCDVDRNPQAPWGRPVTPPGREVCTLEVSWEKATGPVLMDPQWSFTGKMTRGRSSHQAVRLADYRVLVTGGTGGPSNSAEIYDQSTGTFAVAANMRAARSRHSSTRLSDGRVLVAELNDTEGAETYDPETGSWTLTGPSPERQQDHQATRLPSGNVLVTGASQSSNNARAVSLFHAATNSWSTLPAMLVERTNHLSLPIEGGALIAGGAVFGTQLDSASVYRDFLGWSATASMPTGHSHTAGALLSNGQALVVAGNDTSEASVYDPQSKSWHAAARAKYVRTDHHVIAFSDASALVVGGYGREPGTATANRLTSTEYYSATSDGFVAGLDMRVARSNFTATLLYDDGRQATVLVTGGSRSGDGLDSAELLTGKLRGLPCGIDSDCLSNACVDGVCCDTRCEAECYACAASVKGFGDDGVCEAVPEGTDPKQHCEDEGVQSCGRTGECGVGKCALYEAGLECAEGLCYTDKVTFTDGETFACDGQGSCESARISCCSSFGNCAACYYGVCDVIPGGNGGSAGGGGSGQGGSGQGGSGQGGSGQGGGQPSGGSSGSGESGSRSQDPPTSDPGCGCAVPGRRAPRVPSWLLASLLLAGARRRRRREL